MVDVERKTRTGKIKLLGFEFGFETVFSDTKSILYFGFFLSSSIFSTSFFI
jgi:hypothetical protein